MRSGLAGQVSSRYNLISVITKGLGQGPARDITHLPIRKLVINSQNATGCAVGHSPKATDAGVPEQYVGGIPDGFWSLLASCHSTRYIRAPTTATTPFKAKGLRPKEVTESKYECIING